MESSLVLIMDVLSDSEELLRLSGPLYTIKLSRFVRSGGSANCDKGSVRDDVRLGGEGLPSRSGEAIALCDLFLAAGLPGVLDRVDGLMGSRIGGCGDSDGSTCFCLAGRPGLPNFLGGEQGLLGLDPSCLLRKTFLLNKTAVLRFTPLGVCWDELLSSFFDETDDSVVRELSDDRLLSTKQKTGKYFFHLVSHQK